MAPVGSKLNTLRPQTPDKSGIAFWPSANAGKAIAAITLLTKKHVFMRASQNGDWPWRHAAAQGQYDNRGIYQPNGRNNICRALFLYLLPAHLQALRVLATNSRHPSI
jgi:hypothetical protein